MSLETQITALVTAANSLTNAVNGKVSAIDEKVAAATAAVPEAVRSEMAKVFYVDSAVGSDTNLGTQASPFRTVALAVSKVPRGGIGTIFLNSGLEYEVGGGGGLSVDATARYLTFYRYGAASARPVLKGVKALYAGSTRDICNAFYSSTTLRMKFSGISIKTGRKGENLVQGSGFGGFFSRHGGVGESVSFELMFHDSEIAVQDFELVSTAYGFLNISIATSSIFKDGDQSLILTSVVPKVVDLHNVVVSGFGASGIDTLMSINSDNSISRKGTVTVGV